MTVFPTMLLEFKDERFGILILTTNLENYRLLRELLADRYEVYGEPEIADARVDLCICDISKTTEYDDFLNRLGTGRGILKPPLVGLLNQHERREHLLVRYDEVIRLPSTRSEISRRIAVLLHARQLAIRNLKLLDALNERVQLLERATSRAESANDAKSAFLANMSHEIRTPLNAIMGYGDLLTDDGLSPAQLSHVNIIRRNGKALATLIDDILDLSKVEAGKLHFELQTFDLRQLIADVLEIFREKALVKHIDITTTDADDWPAVISSDAARLRQILVNILGNAVKFTDRGAIEVSTAMKPRPDGDLAVVIAIKDSGIGLTEEQCGRLFEPFVQAESTTSRRFGGTGLGLALSRRLAQGLGGDVKVGASAKNQGSTFEISFVAKPAAPGPAAPEEFVAPPPAIPSRARILLVDDSADNRTLMELVLGQKKYRVDTAADGREGVQKALAGSYDIILMDIQMPIMDGFEALNELHRLGFDRPVVALTAHAMTEERVKTRRAGFAAHLVKPIERERMFRTIEDLIRSE